MATTLIPPLDYTSRDYPTILQDLKDRIPFYLSEWTDYNDTDIGIVLLGLYSGIADQLHWTLDRYANECFLPTAITRPSVIKLLNLIDYEPDSAVPSTVDLTFILGQSYGGQVTIPSGTKCQTQGSDPVIFETTEDLDIPAGNLTGTVGAREGESFLETVSAPTGQPYQEYVLDLTGIIDGSVKVYVNEGGGEEEWTEVDTFVDQGPTDKVYTVSPTTDGYTKIAFGDNGQGKIPINNSTIKSEYRVGGGTRGNVGSGTVTEINDTILYLGSPVTVSVNNSAAATGGLDEESIEDAKRKGPQSLRTRWGLITEEDYADAAENVSGVAKAVAVGEGYRTVKVYIAPEGGGAPTDQLKQDVADYLETRKIVTTEIFVLDPVYVDVNYVGTVYVLDNYVRVDVETTVGQTIDDFFDFDGRSFGGSVRLSDSYSTVDGVSGVDYVDFDEHTMTPVVTEEAWSGDAAIGTFVLTNDTVKETWTVTFTSLSDFTVEGAVAGIQTSTGAVNTAYTVDDGSFGFTITTGSVDPVAGDRATIRASEKRGNIILNRWEIAQKGTVSLTFSGGAT